MLAPLSYSSIPCTGFAHCKAACVPVRVRACAHARARLPKRQRRGVGLGRNAMAWLGSATSTHCYRRRRVRDNGYESERARVRVSALGDRPAHHGPFGLRRCRSGRGPPQAPRCPQITSAAVRCVGQSASRSRSRPLNQPNLSTRHYPRFCAHVSLRLGNALRGNATPRLAPRHPSDVKSERQKKGHWHACLVRP